MFLIGMQAMFWEDPPTYFRSITATRWPCPAKVQAAIVPPVPPPRITRSYSSGLVFLGDGIDEAFSSVFIPLFLSQRLPPPWLPWTCQDPPPSHIPPNGLTQL